jgi:hypothetical protein
MRTTLKLVIAGVALAAMAWSSLLIYWHLKISNAVRQLEQNDSPMAGFDALQFLSREAGCRALPYLVGATDPKQPPFFLERSTALIAIILYGPGPTPPPWYISTQDSPEQRARKCEMLREFWRQNGRRHHQMWRVWSSRCG